jgi:CRP-like cAMP-binding protein
MLNMRTLDGHQLIEQLGIDYFKAGSSFGALSDQCIRFLIERGVVLQLDKGDKLFSYGDPGDSFYIVLKGRIEYLKPRGNGFTHIRDYTFGQEFGCVAMIGLHDRAGDHIAPEESVVVQVTSGLFHALQEALPKDFGLFLLNLSREMARRLRESDSKLVENEINR